MLPNESSRRPKEEATLWDARQLLDQGRVGPALSLLVALARDESTSIRGLRTAAALFARAHAVSDAIATFRALAQRYEHEGHLRLAAGALHQAYAFAKTSGTPQLVEDVRADLAHALDSLGFRADAREVLGQAEAPASGEVAAAPEPTPARDEVAIVRDDEIVEVAPLVPDEEITVVQVPKPRPAPPRLVLRAKPMTEPPRAPVARKTEPPRSRPRTIREPSKDEVEATIAEIDFFLEIGDLGEAREIAQAFLARVPHDPTITAILDGLALFETLESVPPSVQIELRRQA